MGHLRQAPALSAPFRWTPAGPDEVEVVDDHSGGVPVLPKNGLPTHPGERGGDGGIRYRTTNPRAVDHRQFPEAPWSAFDRGEAWA